MLPNGRRLGAHLPLGHGMVRAADRAAAIGASAIQVFTDNPTAWRRRQRLPAELPAFRDRLAALDITPISVHAPYLVNLAGPEPELFERSVTTMIHELRVADAYGARFLNMHIGSHRGAGTEAGVARLVMGLRRVLDSTDGGATGVRLVLENGSGGGFGMGSSMEELAEIERAALAAGIDRARFGYCLDTAHLWAAGYPVGERSGVDETLAAFDAGPGLDRLWMVHLNDSRCEGGSRMDRHEHVGAGEIGEAGLARFLTHPDLDHVVYYVETPGMDDGYDEVNVRRALDLATGRTLEPLPPEAFEVHSAKSRSAPAEADEGPGPADADRPA
jgi:deoxyribonuclease IV